MHYAAKFSVHGRFPRARLTNWGVTIALVVAFVLPAVGCVRRRLNVRTNPPGALVYVDNQQIGTTPCSVDFLYYGTREIRLIKPGFETLTVSQPIPTPWYQYIPLDFVSENLILTKLRDNRTVTYNLAPQLIVHTQELVGRASQLRQDTLQFPGAPAGAPIPAGVLPAPTAAPAPTLAPTVTVPEPLPGLGPPPTGPPVVPTPVPVPGPAPQPILAPPP